MNRAEIRQWVYFFCGILVSIVTADTLSNIIMSLAGLSGAVRFLAGFILYAALFFGILYGIERATGIRFLGFSRRLE